MARRGFPVDSRWGVRELPSNYPWMAHREPMGCLWDASIFSWVAPWVGRGVPVGNPQVSRGLSVGFP